MKEKEIEVLFIGHTHSANIFFLGDDYRISETFIDLEDEAGYDLSRYKRSIVNVSICGYPRNQPYSIYGIYDTEKVTFLHRILPFDFDDYIRNMKKHNADIPIWIEKQKERAELLPVSFK